MSVPDLDPTLAAAYDARGSVPDYAVYPRLYRSLSDRALVRATHVELGYGPGEGERLHLFGQPAGAAAPVFVFIHGGYWRALSKEDSAFVAPVLHEAGAVVVVLDYALAPAVTLTHIVDQIRRAVGWVHREISAHGGDPARIVMSGSSAGAHLAAMTLTSGWHDRYGVPPEAISGAVLLSGLYDLAPLTRTDAQAWMHFDEESVMRNSPLLHLPAAPSARLAVVHGEHEPAGFVTQSQRLAAAWRDRGGDVLAAVIPDRDHFSVLVDLSEPESLITSTALDLLGLTPATGDTRP